jgi:hypothetical protein
VFLEPGEIGGDDVGDRTQQVGGATKHDGLHVSRYSGTGVRKR